METRGSQVQGQPKPQKETLSQTRQNEKELLVKGFLESPTEGPRGIQGPSTPTLELCARLPWVWVDFLFGCQNVITPPPCHWNKRGFISSNKKALWPPEQLSLASVLRPGGKSHAAPCSVSSLWAGREGGSKAQSSSLPHPNTQRNSEVTKWLRSATRVRVLLRMDPRALGVLGKCFTTVLPTPGPCISS